MLLTEKAAFAGDVEEAPVEIELNCIFDSTSAPSCAYIFLRLPTSPHFISCRLICTPAIVHLSVQVAKQRKINTKAKHFVYDGQRKFEYFTKAPSGMRLWAY